MAVRVVPTIEEIERASKVLDPVFANSPLLTGTVLDERLGMRLAFKVETLNPIRSFKGRGASAWMAQVKADSPGTGADAQPSAGGVVCASAGNFGQALAYAARSHGIACRVFVGESANTGKIEAMRGFGAQVEVGGADYDAAIATARATATEIGWRFVQDGKDPWIAAGAGTIAAELTRAGLLPDVAVVPVGNSALILGIARWLRHHHPEVRIVGVCAENAPAPALSWRTGVPTSASAVTVADGIGVREPFAESVAGMLELVDAMELVDEATLKRAVRTLASDTGLVVEPAGAAGLAALLSNPTAWRDAKVFTPLCGAHLPPGALGWGTDWTA